MWNRKFENVTNAAQRDLCRTIRIFLNTKYT